MPQGIIDMNRNGNSANFFSYVCNDKIIKELFASFLNEKPISVICVSSIILVFNAKFDRLLAAHANKKSVRTEETRQECRVLLAETHWRSTFIAVYIVHAKTSLFYTFQRSVKANRKLYVYARKKHPSSGYPAAKHPKHSKFAITDMREKPVNFFYNAARAPT